MQFGVSRSLQTRPEEGQQERRGLEVVEHTAVVGAAAVIMMCR